MKKKYLLALTLFCVLLPCNAHSEETKIPPAAKKALLDKGIKEIVFAERQFSRDGHWYANFGYVWSGPDKKLSENGGRLLKLNVETGKVITLLEDAEGSVRDPQVHYDAKKILFSYRKGGTDQFHLYEIGVDGKNLKQLTDGIYDDIEPTYLPDGGIAFASARSKRWVNCWLVQVANLYRCDADGKNARVLSVNIEQDNTPWVLADGRILFTRWEYVDRSQVKFHHLWTCNPDGTEQKVFYGNMHPGGVFIDAKPIPDSDEVLYINSPGHGSREHAGYVAIVTDKHGPDEKSATRNISKEKHFRDPYPLSDKLFLVAKEKNQIVLMDEQGKITELYKGKDGVSEPRPIIKRQRERVIPSRIDLNKPTGTLILSDVYQGRKMEGVERGEIKKLLILETLPKPLNYGGGMHDFIPITHGGTFTLERILGSVPVEQDGSAHFEVPANRPLFFIAVNEKNESVKRMHSFLSVMPGEVLSCVGCHEERMKTPLTSATSLQAMKRPANKIKPVPGVPYMIDFPRDIQPILDKHCVKCHSPKQPDGKIILTGDLGPIFSHSYFTLTTAGYVSDGRNRHGNTSIRGVGDSASQLMKMLDGSHYKAKLSPAEVEMIRNWIHVGASYPGTYAALGTGMVRLNALPKEHHAAYEAAKKAAEKAFDKSCMHCHKNQMPRAGKHSISGTTKPESLSWNSHTAFNLTSPENSRLLLAPLAKSAGGWGLCQAKDEGQKKFEGELFRDRNDEEYRALLAYVKAAKDTLDENKRWCMPGYKPHPYYVREMKRYGILPESFDIDRDKIDVFEVDRRYWESAWYYPKGDGPKLHKNEKMKKMLIFPEKGVQWEKDLTATVKE